MIEKELVEVYLCIRSIMWLALGVDTIERQLIFILNFSLLHVRLCLFMTSSCWPHSGLESPFKFPAELLLKSNCIQANNSAWCDQRFNRRETFNPQRSVLPFKAKTHKIHIESISEYDFLSDSVFFSVLVYNTYIYNSM